MIGQKISHYEIHDVLGSGGMGTVYKAKDLKLGRFVAIKFLNKEQHASSESRQRFINEARTISTLDHPNIAVVYEIDEFDDRIFISMGFYEGQNLQEMLVQGPLPIQDVLSISKQIASGLSEAHKAGIIHRDIKPGNIILTKDNQVKILDFGLSKGSDVTLVTKEDTILGTAAYMSPEQIQGKPINHRSDLFSFGILMYEMVSGERPFSGEYSAAVTYSIMHEEPIPLHQKRPDIPGELESIIAKALNKNEERRYQSAPEILNELEAIQGDSPAGSASIRKGNLSSLSTKAKLYIGGFFFAVLVVILFFVMSGRKNPPTQVSIAVMPFQFRGEDSDSKWLGKAIMELVNTGLSENEFLQILDTEHRRNISTNLGFKEDNLTITQQAQIAQKSNSQRFIRGQLQKSGSSIRVQAEIINAVEPNSIIQLEAIRSDNLHNAADRLIAMINNALSPSRESTTSTAELTTQSLDAFRYFIEGQDAALDRRHEESIAKLKKAISYDSDYVRAYYWLAYQYDELGQQNKAGEILAKIKPHISKLSKKEQLEYLKEEARIENRFNDYVTYLEQVIQLDPSDANAQYSYGWALYYKFRRVDAGIAAMKKALEIDPSYSIAYNSLGYAYLVQGRIDMALTMIDKFIELNPSGVDPLDSKAEILLFTGRYQEAQSLCERVLAIKPDFLMTHRVLIRIFMAQGKYTRASEAIEKYMDIANNLNDLSRGQVLRAQLHYNKGEFDKALEYADQAVALDSRNPEALWLRGRILVKLQMKDELQKTSKSLEQVLVELGGLDGRWLLLHLQGEKYLQEQNYEQAIEAFQNAVDLGVWDRSLYLTELANAYANSDQLQKAVEHYEAALAFNSNYALAAFGLGKTYELLKQFEKAKLAYQKVTKIWSSADSELSQLVSSKQKIARL